MRLTRPAATVVLVLGALLFTAAPTPAGGPTSVLLVSPSTGQTASLHVTDESYTRLLEQLGDDPVTALDAPLTPPGIGGDQIIVTWMIHDVRPWRVDHITLDGAGLPQWVYTIRPDDGGAVDLGAGGAWHRPADAERLTDLLSSLGLTGRVARTGLWVTGTDPYASNAAAAPAPPEDGGTDAATWAAPAVAGGILVGVLLGVTSDRWLRRRRTRADDGGRWQLVDVPGPPV